MSGLRTEKDLGKTLDCHPVDCRNTFSKLHHSKAHLNHPVTNLFTACNYSFTAFFKTIMPLGSHINPDSKFKHCLFSHSAKITDGYLRVPKFTNNCSAFKKIIVNILLMH